MRPDRFLVMTATGVSLSEPMTQTEAHRLAEDHAAKHPAHGTIQVLEIQRELGPHTPIYAFNAVLDDPEGPEGPLYSRNTRYP
jgi:hypothetical protein